MRQGAQALIVPTMDVETWGRYQHWLHGRVAPVRAAEYGLPIFRLASSGISQHVTATGRVAASAPFPGQGDIIAAEVELRGPGRLPLDRYLAPVCVGVTVVLAALAAMLSLKRAWRERRSPAQNHPQPQEVHRGLRWRPQDESEIRRPDVERSPEADIPVRHWP